MTIPVFIFDPAAGGGGSVPTTRVITAGAGLTGGGDLSADRTIDAVANADASIVVNANDIQVGVLATDAQHGLRGGGTQHAVVIAAGAAGFMTGADKTKLNSVATDAAALTNADLPVNVDTAAGAVGIGTTAARHDHKHDVTTAAPTAGIGGSNAEGSAAGLARADHDHTIRETGGPTNLTVAAIADGAFVKRSGTTLIGASASAFLDSWDANLVTFPASAPAGATSRNGHPVLTFDDTTAENVVIHDVLSADYATGSVSVRVDWVAATATTGAVVWGIEVERDTPGGQDIDADGFAAQQTATSTTSGTSGIVTRTTITLTQAQADSWTAGDAYRMRVQRVAANGSDTLVGDAQVLRVSMVQ